MNVLTELKRRNVFRMAGLYVVGAWLITQVADTILPMFGAPDWVARTVVVLLAIGFVPALIFSWVFELTPEGIKRDGEVTPNESMAPQTARRMDRLLLVGMLVVIGVIAADHFWSPTPEVMPNIASSSEAAPAAADLATGSTGLTIESAAIDPNSIAVLPFVNMSPDADNEYFSDGISEELLNALITVNGLSVASRTSSFAFKGRELSASAIGAEMRVAHVLEGSVRKAGNRVRITAQLIDTARDRQLWTDSFDRELDDIFAIQDEIAKAIVDALRDTLAVGDTSLTVAVRADTQNLDAYQLYLKARELFLTRTRLDESVRLFEQVVELDPNFARGWEGLAAASAVIVDWVQTYPDVDRAASLLRVEQAAERALALDPNLSMPRAARSLAATHATPADFVKAMTLINQAIEIEPRNASAVLWRGIYWLTLGFMDRAQADFEACLAIDPAYENCVRWKAVATLYQGRTDAGLALYEQGMSRGFNSNRIHNFVEALIHRGDTIGAWLLMRELGWPVEVQRAVMTSVTEGKPASNVKALVQRYPEDPRAAFLWAMLLRDYPLAADSEMGSFSIEHWDPSYTGLRNSPAFKRIVERLGVLAFWRAEGYPPQCRPAGADDFHCDDNEGGR